MNSSNKQSTVPDILGRVPDPVVSGDVSSVAGRVGLPRRIIVGSIHLYQAARTGRPSPCRFIPSCSAYGEEAIAVHGVVRGSLLTMKRIVRCRPGGGFGVDLVPPAHRTPNV